MPVREGPIAVWGDQVQVVLCWWWLVAALVEVGVAAVVGSAFQLVHVQRELLFPLALAVPVLGLLLVRLVDVLARVSTAVADHRFVRETSSTSLKSVLHSPFPSSRTNIKNNRWFLCRGGGCCVRCAVKICWCPRVLTSNTVVTFWPRIWISEHPVLPTLDPDKTIRLHLCIRGILDFHAGLTGVLNDIIQRHHFSVPNKVVVGAVLVGNVGDVVAVGEDALELVDGRTVRLVPQATCLQRLSGRVPASDLADQVTAIFALPAV